MFVHRIWVLVFVVSAGFAAMLWPGRAVRAGGIRQDVDSSRDVLQTIQARQLLFQEPELAHLNIGVTVRNRVATLWGPVPSAESAFRAELCLRLMIELVDVRNELFVFEEPEPIGRPRKLEMKPIFLPGPMPPALPKDTRLAPGAPGIFMRQELSWSRQNLAPEMKVLTSEKAAPPVLAVPQQEREWKKITDPADGTQADRKLADAVRSILQTNRLQDEVQFSVKDGRIYLRAIRDGSNAVHQAVRAVAPLVNIDGVIILDKTLPR